MKVKDFVKGLKEANGGALPDKDKLKSLIGLAFEVETRARIVARKLGLVERRAAWGLKKELFMYAKALSVSVGLEIEQWEFDRIVDHILDLHNAVVEKERQDRMSKSQTNHRSTEDNRFVAQNFTRDDTSCMKIGDAIQ